MLVKKSGTFAEVKRSVGYVAYSLKAADTCCKMHSSLHYSFP